MMLTKEQLDKLRGVVNHAPEKSVNNTLQSETFNKEAAVVSGNVLNNLNPKWKNLVERYESSVNAKDTDGAVEYDEFGVVIPDAASVEPTGLPKISEFGIQE